MDYLGEEPKKSFKPLIIGALVVFGVVVIIILFFVFLRPKNDLIITSGKNLPKQENTNSNIPKEKLQPGIDRALSTEEKIKYGFVSGENIWMKTTSPTNGTNPQAYFYTKNPEIKFPLDTDHDGLSDVDEINIYHTDPFKADTDADDATDRDEVKAFKTDPLNKDSDRDGVNDGNEIESGTNPLDPSSK